MILHRVMAVGLGMAAYGWGLCANAMVLTAPVHVTKFHAYTDSGNGDVLFNVSATVAGCDGFWLYPDDKGFKQAYAALMMAKAADMAVVIYAYDTELWPASTDKYCRVRTLSPE